MLRLQGPRRIIEGREEENKRKIEKKGGEDKSRRPITHDLLLTQRI